MLAAGSCRGWTLACGERRGSAPLLLAVHVWIVVHMCVHATYHKAREESDVLAAKNAASKTQKQNSHVHTSGGSREIRAAWRA
eukprot:4356971-Prymnesium_polylepis.2